MAQKVALATGDWNVAATWLDAVNTPTIHASTNNTINTTGIFGQTLVAANTNNILGFLVYPVASWSGKTITFTLQANSVDTPTTIVINGSDLNLNQPLFLKLSAPYAKTAGVTYRLKAQTNTSTCTIAQSSTASQFACMILEAASAAPAVGDSVYYCCPNSNTDITVTITDTSAVCGNNATLSAAGAFMTTNRAWDMAIQGSGGVNNIANLKFDPNANTKLDPQNSAWIAVNAKVEQKPTSAYTSKVSPTIGATLSQSLSWNFTQGALYDIQGVGLTTSDNWKSTFVSGLGTAASPAVVTTGTGSEWKVGDFLALAPTDNTSTNYNNFEYRYIISKPTDDSMVLSSTSGGSENALVNTHTGGYVFNNDAGKNVEWKPSDNRLWSVGSLNTAATNSNSKFRWAKITNMYSNGGSAKGGFWITGGQPLIEYISLSRPDYSPTTELFNQFVNNVNIVDNNIKGLFAFGGTVTAQAGVLKFDAVNGTYTDCWVVDTTKSGISASGPVTTMNNCGWIACNKGNLDLWGGFATYGPAIVLNDCEGHCNRKSGIIFYTSSPDLVANRYLSGTKGSNAGFASCGNTPLYVTALFNDVYKHSSEILMSTNNFVGQSQMVLSNINGVAYENAKLTKNGEAHITGAGLADTTIPVLGSYAYRHDPLTTVGMKYRYTQIASPGSNFLTYGKIWGNSAFVSDGATSITVDLYMPGQVEGVDTPTDSVTMTKTTSKTSANAQFNLKGYYSGSIPSDALIVVTIKNPNATPNVYAYIGDILNANNDVTKFKVMYQGQPSLRMPETAGESGVIATAVTAGVWGDNSVYPVGTKGKAMIDMESNTDATQAKVDVL